MTQSKVHWVKLSDCITSVKKRSGDDKAIVSGVDISKQFIPTRANLEETDISKYYLVPPKHFACNLMHIGRDERLPIAYNDSDDNYVVTSAYYVFKVSRSDLMCEYLYIFFNSTEIDRLTWFYTDSSVRGNLKEERFLDIQIPLPSIEEQQKIVDVWKSLRKVKEDNEKIAEPLFQLCQSYIQNLKATCPSKEIGAYIESSDERNTKGFYQLDDVRGISIEKRIIDTKANMEGVSLSSYKQFQPHSFCFVPITSRNGDKITIAINDTDNTFIVSQAYEVFKIKGQGLIPEYLFMWFCRPEFDRYARFNSWGSAREAFSLEDMKRVKVPIPSIETQKAIVDLFICSKEAKRIAEEADKQSRNLCPALMQYVINA